MTTDLPVPRSPAPTKLPFWPTDRFTSRLRVDSAEARTVKLASMPSTWAAPPVTLIVGVPLASVMEKPPPPVPRAPPWRLLPELALSGARATDTDSSVSMSVSVAARRIRVAVAAPPPCWPPKVTVGGLLAGLLLARLE